VSILAHTGCRQGNVPTGQSYGLQTLPHDTTNVGFVRITAMLGARLNIQFGSELPEAWANFLTRHRDLIKKTPSIGTKMRDVPRHRNDDH